MQEIPKETVKEVLDGLNIRPVLEYLNYRTDTIQETDRVVRCFCPIHHEQVFRTLSIDQKNKKAKCSYNPCPGHKGLDLIDLVAQSKQLDFNEALVELVQHFELNVNVPGAEEFLAERLESARQMLESGDLDKAYDNFAKVVNIQPENAEALRGMVHICEQQGKEGLLVELQLRLAGLHLKHGEYAEAEPIYEKYCASHPADIDNRMRYAECLHHLGRDEEMVREMSAIAKAFEDNNEVEKALETYRRIDHLQPGAIDVNAAIVQLMVRAGRIQEAADQLIARADDLRDDDRLEEALACYDQVLELDPSRDDVRQSYIEAVLGGPDLSNEEVERCLELIDGFAPDDGSDLAIRSLEHLRDRYPSILHIGARIHRMYLDKGMQTEADEMAYELAQNYLDAGDFQGALDWIEPLSRRPGPGMPIALSLKANIFRAMGDIPQTISTLLQIVKLYEEADDYQSAMPFFEEILEVAPEEIDIHARRLRALVALGRGEETTAIGQQILPLLAQVEDPQPGIGILELLRAQSPDNHAFLFTQARLLMRADRASDAREQLMQAANRAGEENRLEEGVEILEHLIDLDADDMRAAEKLADFKMELGEREEALDAYRQLAHIYGQSGEPDAQLDVLLKVAEATPDDVEVLHQLLPLYEQLDNPRDARQLRGRIAEIHKAQGDYDKALDLCGQILEVDPEDTPTLALCLEIHEARKDPEAILEDGIKLFEILRRDSQFEDARVALDKVRQHFPEDPRVLERQVLLLCDLEQFEQALPVAQQLLEGHRAQGNEGPALEFLRRVIGISELFDQPLLGPWVDLCRDTGRLEELWDETAAILQRLREAGQAGSLYDLIAELVAEYPDFDPVRDYQVELYRSTGKSRRAIEALETWAGVLRDRGDNEGALDKFNRALEINPEDLDLLAEILDFKAEAGIREGAADLALKLAERLDRDGLTAQAIQTLDTGLKLDPSRQELRERILALEELAASPTSMREKYTGKAREQIELEDYDSARSTLIEGIGKFPADLALRRQLVELYRSHDRKEEMLAELGNICSIQAELGDLSEALRVSEEILAADPENLKGQAMQAEIHARLGDDQKALEEYRKLSKSIGQSDPTRLKDLLVAKPAGGGGNFEMLPIREEYCFKEYIVGSRNNFAYATAMAIANNPGQEYNPLFLYGDVGLGKTHLLQAVAIQIRESHPDLKVLYTSSEEFTNALIEAISGNTIKQFRNLHKSPDVLLIDDVHYLAEKERAQEEFFQIFNTLYQGGRQIVLTSDRPPKEITHLERRLRSRFGAGIIVDIQPPDLETRMAILRREAEMAEEDIDDDVLKVIASRIETNVRELKSVLRQMIARIRIGNEEPGKKLVDQIIEQVAGAHD